MQVEAIYNRGTLAFVHPLKLKHDSMRLLVNVPDEAVEVVETADNLYSLSPEVLQAAADMRQRLNAELHAPLPPDDELPELNSDHDERSSAMAQRAELRQAHGRPV